MGESGDLLPRAEIRAIFSHLRGRFQLLVSMFLIGFIVGYPMAEYAIEWLLDAEGYRPVGVEIIVLQPMEIILLKLRIASQIGIAILLITLISDLAWNGRRIIAEGKRVVTENSGGSFARFLGSLLVMILLGGLGLFYAHVILVPFLLDYLAADAGAAGLDSTWQLRSWIGFILGLYFGSALSFQVPLVAVMLVRTSVVSRSAFTDNRGFLWFAAFAIGAFLSPPDPLSMFLVGGPMLVLLELALLIERMVWKS
ncbi:MAG: twin-arginine translocase subunit TatC [Candidatus Thalassarchaeaceae archaeon]|nr:twin-arginine translocase subunit TatC [Candidatus Thalassarchaeaceae archaeon]